MLFNFAVVETDITTTASKDEKAIVYVHWCSVFGISYAIYSGFL